MTEEHIHIMRIESRPKSNLYYYQGNFYYPYDVSNAWLGKVRNAIRVFSKKNKKLIEDDRKDPEYKTLTQLFDQQEAIHG